MEIKTKTAQELQEIIKSLRSSDLMKQAVCVSKTDVGDTAKYGEAGDFLKLFSGINNYAGVGYCKWNVLSGEGFATDIWYTNLGEEAGTDLQEVFMYVEGVHPEDRARLHDALKDMLQGKITLIQDVIRTIDKSTGEFTNWVYCNTIFNKVDIENNILEILAVNIDITQFKKLELELIKSRNEAFRLLEQRELVSRNLTIGITYINKDYVVEWGTVMTGPLASQNYYIPGQLCYKSAFNRDTPCEKCAFREMLATGKSAAHEIAFDGQYIEIVANPSFDENGNLVGGVMKLDNITKQRVTEQKIKELNRLMEVILNNIPVYLFVKDPNNEFRYLYWNKAMATHTCIPVEKVIGNTDLEVFPLEKDAIHFREDDMRLLDGGVPIEFEENFVNARGETRHAFTTKTMVPSDGELPWIMGLSWDITEMKMYQQELIEAKERAEESDRFKSSFIANMGHEIRTPLNAIVGFSELLTDETITPQEREEYLTIIRKNNQLLLQLVSDILDLSKIEARMLDFNYDNVDINALCNRIVTLCSMRADAKVPIVFNDNQESLYINTDENRVHQIITNLVNNAVKFTTKGQIEISMKCVGDSHIEISVQDSGTGIPKDKIDAVFGRFVKLNSFVQGTGLGLSICKNLVEQLGGEIGVESEPGNGSRFWFTLPLKAPKKR